MCNERETIRKDITEIMDVSHNMITKINIATEIKKCIYENHLSVRKLGEQIGLKHPQIIRVTNANNYNIDTLLKILDGLNLEVIIKKRDKVGD
ncbi:helix-turn-helix domain-containing protein (plasmid) [Bacillus subtilis]|uniref:DNA binding protein n=2 Tax=root TaxID=1 RepID=A0AC61TTA8_9CAUD|nr:helix-turn-helix domain-containing protein [Bacillus amyloliquefaciens]YP_010681681.1 DNA binding protein [Bacillus phage vB_BsuS_PJN02]UNH58406.1 DNA binding protein [Bacillus phage vB_BsuS_PJN02]